MLARLLSLALGPVPLDEDGPEKSMDLRGGALDVLRRVVDQAVAKLAAGHAFIPAREVCDPGPLLALSPELRAAAVVEAFAQLESHDTGFFRSVERSRRSDVLSFVISRLMRAELPFTTRQLMFIGSRSRAIRTAAPPFSAVVRAMERHAARAGLGEELQRVARGLAESIARNEYLGTRNRTSLARRLRAIAVAPDRHPYLATGMPAERGDRWLGDRLGELGHDWRALLIHAAAYRGAKRPSKKWRSALDPLVAAIGETAFRSGLRGLLDDHPPYDDEAILTPATMRGLLWTAADVTDAPTRRALARFAERRFHPEPGVWESTDAIGTTALRVLAAVPEMAGIAEITKLRSRLRRPPVQRRIEEVLDGAARDAGIGIGALEERAIPDFGLNEAGVAIREIGDFETEIRVTGASSVALRWRTKEGRPRKGVPVAVKREHPAALAGLRDDVRQIRQMLAGQAARIERCFVEERRWSLDDWRRYYLDHPLVGGLSRRLIWTFEADGRRATAMPRDGALVDAAGSRLALDEAPATVSLWHPMDASEDEIVAWRRQLGGWGIVQPFKQAHREVYILTDAERATETYSNRFAAHILRQRTFSRLCQQRNWRYPLQGEWSGENTATRPIASHRLQACFSVDAVEADDSFDYIYSYLSSDFVLFATADGDHRVLEEVPPRVFSEVMRDIDLFVSVCSIGNDPEWTDTGPQGVYFPYWEGYSFGDLLESGRTRRQVLEALLPKLRIADRCTLSERFLLVRGKRRGYRIHLGSSNVIMEPGNRYLCIVPKGAKRSTSGVRLPFEGDAMLSTILSKAFMLADDDNITDRSILSQMGRR